MPGGPNVNLASTTISMRVSNRRLRRGTREATNELRKVQRRQRELQRATQRVTRQFRSFASRLLNVRTIVGTLAGSAGIGLLVRNMSELGRQLGVQIERSGLAARDFRALQGVFAEGGLQADETADAIAAMTERIGEAQDPTTQQAQDFQLLGVEVTALDGSARSLSGVLADVADAVANSTDETRTSTIISRLFSTEGERLQGVLRRGRSEFIALEERHRSLTRLTDESIMAVRDLGASFNTTGRFIQDLLIESFAPFADEIDDLNISFREFARDHAPGAVRGLIGIANNLDTIITTLLIGSAIGGLISVVGTVSSIARTATALESLNLATLNVFDTAGSGSARIASLRSSIANLALALRPLLIGLGATALLLGGIGGIAYLFYRAWQENQRWNRILSGSPTHLNEMNEALQTSRDRVANLRQELADLREAQEERPGASIFGGPELVAVRPQDVSAAEARLAEAEQEQDAILASRRRALVGLRRGGLGGGQSRFGRGRARLGALPTNARFVGPSAGDNEEDVFGPQTIQEEIRANQILADVEEERQAAALARERELANAREESFRSQMGNFNLLQRAQDAFIQAASSSVAASIVQAQDLREALLSTLQAVIQQVIQLSIAESLTTLLAGGAAGVQRSGNQFRVGAFTNAAGNVSPGFRQAGGPIGPGLYLAGEAGPELIAYSGNRGRVFSAGQTRAMGGGNTFNFNISGSDEATVRRGIELAIPNIVQAAEQRVTRNIARPGPLNSAVRTVRR